MLDDTVCKVTQYFPQRNFMVAGKHFHGCRKTYLAFITHVLWDLLNISISNYNEYYV